MKKHLACAFLLVAAGLACQPAVAQTANWPTRPVKLIVGFAPGGPTDLFARLIAQSSPQQTGKNFFIENVPGAGGNVGAVRAAQSAPDGYTFLVTGGNITNNPFLFARTGYDPIKDFEPVTLGAQTPVVLAINPSVPRTASRNWWRGCGLIPPRKATPRPALVRRRNWSARCSRRPETRPRACAVQRRGHCGAGDRRQSHPDFVRRDGACGAADQGRAVARAGGTGKQRSPALPDVPTMAEAGFPEVEVSTWTAVMAPAHTPKDVVDKLRGMIVRALAASDVKQKLAAMAYVPIGSTPEECDGVPEGGNGQVGQSHQGRRAQGRVKPGPADFRNEARMNRRAIAGPRLMPIDRRFPVAIAAALLAFAVLFSASGATAAGPASSPAVTAPASGPSAAKQAKPPPTAEDLDTKEFERFIRRNPGVLIGGVALPLILLLTVLARRRHYRGSRC